MDVEHWYFHLNMEEHGCTFPFSHSWTFLWAAKVAENPLYPCLFAAFSPSGLAIADQHAFGILSYFHLKTIGR